MTRAAVREGVEHYLSRLVYHAYEQFDVRTAVKRGTSGVGAHLLTALLARSAALEERIVRPELESYQSAVLDQFEIILAYAASDEPIEAYREPILERDQFAAAIDPDVDADRRATIEDALVERAARIGDAVAPLVATPVDDFWEAVTDVYDTPAAIEAVQEAVGFTDPLDTYPDAFVFAVDIDPGAFLGAIGTFSEPITVEYTEEATRCLRQAEATIREEVERDVTRQFGAPD